MGRNGNTTLRALLSPNEVSAIIGASVGTLAVWRCVNRYNLPYIKVGRSVRYRPEAVEAFVVEREHGKTA